jgi:hypothetical protein
MGEKRRGRRKADAEKEGEEKKMSFCLKLLLLQRICSGRCIGSKSDGEVSSMANQYSGLNKSARSRAEETKSRREAK